MAMLPFCGYHMADYFAHWLHMPQLSPNPAHLPRIFFVNWFRKDPHGRFLWPGYGENSRILKWIFDRTDKPADDPASATRTPIGYLPTLQSIDRVGLSVPDADMKTLIAFDPDAWRAEAASIHTHYATFKDRLPAPLAQELATLESALPPPVTPSSQPQNSAATAAGG
jgi:phosphoenolpyruvate carboxykinase (GTP)